MRELESGNGARPGREAAPDDLSTRELVSRIVSEGTELVRKEIELARAELAEDLRTELKMGMALGAGAILGICGFTLIFVTIALALTAVMPPWAAGFLVTALVLATAGLVAGIGWARRVRSPLSRTRRHLREDVRFVKERLS